MDNELRCRVRELMFHVVPDPDEIIDDDVLQRCEAMGFEEGERLMAEFRSIIDTLDDWPDVRDTVLQALDDMAASSSDANGDETEWMNVRDVLGRRIRRALEPLLTGD